MKRNDRVELVEDPNTRVRLQLGTVLRVSPSGYVVVRWDDGTLGHFPPIHAELQVREGDAALPRHDWDVSDSNLENVLCLRCKVQQTEENEFAPCVLAAKPLQSSE